jgi:hypothetical protein
MRCRIYVVTNIDVQMEEAEAFLLIRVLGNIGISDETPVRLWSTGSIDSIVSWILADHLLHEAKVHVAAKPHGCLREMWPEVMAIHVEFIIDEAGNRGVLEIGEKVIEDEVSLDLPLSWPTVRLRTCRASKLKVVCDRIEGYWKGSSFSLSSKMR